MLAIGSDLNDAVLAATNQSIEASQNGLVTIMTLSLAGENFPNLDTFTRTDGMAVLYIKSG